MPTLIPPLSKSDAQRALVLADILQVPFHQVIAQHDALPRDVEVLLRGLQALKAPTSSIDCADGGAPFRFLLTQAAVLPGKQVEFKGTVRLGQRPHEPLFLALQAATGARIIKGNPWPIQLTSAQTFTGPFEFKVTGIESSQFASSLLLGAARLAVAGFKVSLERTGPFTSEGYFELTRAWLAKTGFELVDESDLRLSVKAPAQRVPFPPIPGDWSSLGYLLVLSWVSGLNVERLALGTGHPDEAFVSIVRRAGLTVTDSTLEGIPTDGLHVDAQQCPDAVPTLAVLATRLPKPSIFERVGILRHKESDRLEGVMALLRAAGLRASLESDTLTVQPGKAHSFRFDAKDDHRLAMAAAVLARLHEVPLHLRGMESVHKSFPGFWDEASKTQLQVKRWV